MECGSHENYSSNQEEFNRSINDVQNPDVGDADMVQDFDIPVGEEVTLACANFTTEGDTLPDDYEHMIANLSISHQIQGTGGERSDDQHFQFSLPTQQITGSLSDEDVEQTTQAQMLKSTVNRPNRPLKADRKEMRVLLRHIYELTGDVYDDIPHKFRTSHVTLALYLKACLKNPRRRHFFSPLFPDDRRQ